MRTSFKSGFSLLELLVVLVIVGIVLAIGVPGINRARADAEMETMRSRALALQTAKQSFLDAVGPTSANSMWNAQASDQLKYQNLLKQYLPGTYPANLSDLFPYPFGITLQAVDTTLTFIAPDTSGGRPSTPLQKY